MPRTGFDPERHGFAFDNRWRLSESELEELHERSNPLFQQAAILGLAAFGCLGGLLFRLGLLRVREKVEQDLAHGFGLCGGMCFTALDFHKASLRLREQDLDDPPSAESPLYAYIWKRQIQSLVSLPRVGSDGARYMAWMIIMNRVPAKPLGGGPAWLLSQSREEWSKLKASIDDGEPVPILLVRHTDNVYGNHQVLAIGYDGVGIDGGTIEVYDPNCHDEVNTIELEVDDDVLNGEESCGSDHPPLRGFFCQAYEPSDPSDALG